MARVSGELEKAVSVPGEVSEYQSIRVSEYQSLIASAYSREAEMRGKESPKSVKKQVRGLHPNLSEKPLSQLEFLGSKISLLLYKLYRISDDLLIQRNIKG